MFDTYMPYYLTTNAFTSIVFFTNKQLKLYNSIVMKTMHFTEHVLSRKAKYSLGNSQSTYQLKSAQITSDSLYLLTPAKFIWLSFLQEVAQHIIYEENISPHKHLHRFLFAWRCA